MRTEHLFLVWSYISIKAEVSRARKTGLNPAPHHHNTSSFPTNRSKMVPLLLFFVRASVASYSFISKTRRYNFDPLNPNFI